jgi:hypothetical protein
MMYTVMYSKSGSLMNCIFSAIAIAGLISLTGCVPSIKITREFLDPDFSFGQIKPQSRIKIFVSQTFHVEEFRGPYQLEYQTDQLFSSILQNQIADSIKIIIGCSVDPAGDSRTAAILRSTGNDQNSIAVDQMKQLFGGAAENYFFVVTAVDITNKWSSNGTVLMTAPGAGGTFASAGSSESCIVIMHADLWSVKSRRKILSYSSTGESTVKLRLHGEALKCAVSNSIQSMVKYLATGQGT